jgi:hypothetical protein
MSLEDSLKSSPETFSNQPNISVVGGMVTVRFLRHVCMRKLLKSTFHTPSMMKQYVRFYVNALRSSIARRGIADDGKVGCRSARAGRPIIWTFLTGETQTGPHAGRSRDTHQAEGMIYAIKSTKA